MASSDLRDWLSALLLVPIEAGAIHCRLRAHSRAFGLASFSAEWWAEGLRVFSPRSPSDGRVTANVSRSSEKGTNGKIESTKGAVSSTSAERATAWCYPLRVDRYESWTSTAAPALSEINDSAGFLRSPSHCWARYIMNAPRQAASLLLKVPQYRCHLA